MRIFKRIIPFYEEVKRIYDITCCLDREFEINWNFKNYKSNFII